MTPDRARLVIALSATMAPHPDDRVDAVLYIATHLGAQKRPSWWQWCCWLALGITVVRVRRLRGVR